MNQIVLFDPHEYDSASRQRARRRAETRAALDSAAAQTREDELNGYIQAAADQLERVLADLAVPRPDPLPSTAPLAERRARQADIKRWNALHPGLLAQADALRARIGRWQDVLAGRKTWARFVPPAEWDWDDEANEGHGDYVHVDSVCPDFMTIDRLNMDPATLDRLDQTVSDMRNWAYEITGITQRAALHRTVVLDAFKIADYQGTGLDHLGPARTNSKRVVLGKPRPVRAYPGAHYVGTEWLTDERTGRKRRRTAEEQFWLPRVAVLTVWLARRSRWAVYVAHDGGRPDGRFTRWEPMAWYLVEPDDVAHRHPDGTVSFRHTTDVEADTLDRALAVAWMKFQEIRREMGEVIDVIDPLPFDPDVIERIVDARAAEAEHRRRTAEPVEMD